MPCVISGNGVCSYWQTKSRNDFGGSIAKPWSIVLDYKVPDISLREGGTTQEEPSHLSPRSERGCDLAGRSYLFIRAT